MVDLLYERIKYPNLSQFKTFIFTRFRQSEKKAQNPDIKSLKTLLKQKETPTFETHFKNEI